MKGEMNEKAKRLRIASICYFLASAGFYILAVLQFAGEGHLGALHLLLGASMMYLGSLNLKRMREAMAETTDGKQEDDRT